MSLFTYVDRMAFAYDAEYKKGVLVYLGTLAVATPIIYLFIHTADRYSISFGKKVQTKTLTDRGQQVVEWTKTKIRKTQSSLEI